MTVENSSLSDKTQKVIYQNKWVFIHREDLTKFGFQTLLDGKAAESMLLCFWDVFPIKKLVNLLTWMETSIHRIALVFETISCGR